MAEDDYDQIIVRLIGALIPEAGIWWNMPYDLMRKIGTMEMLFQTLKMQSTSIALF